MRQDSRYIYSRAVVWALVTLNVILIKQVLVQNNLLSATLSVSFIPLVYASIKYGRRVGMACAGVIAGGAVAFRGELGIAIEITVTTVFIALMVGEMRHKARLEPTLQWILERLKLILEQTDVIFREWGYTSEQQRLRQLHVIRDRIADFMMAITNRIALVQHDAMWYKKIEANEKETEASEDIAPDVG